jgi:hypothetical protein
MAGVLVPDIVGFDRTASPNSLAQAVSGDGKVADFFESTPILPEAECTD